MAASKGEGGLGRIGIVGFGGSNSGALDIPPLLLLLLLLLVLLLVALTFTGGLRLDDGVDAVLLDFGEGVSALEGLPPSRLDGRDVESCLLKSDVFDMSPIGSVTRYLLSFVCRVPFTEVWTPSRVREAVLRKGDHGQLKILIRPRS